MPAPDPRTDQDLIAAAGQGDPAAFEALYFRYRDWVLRLAWRFTGDHDLALDVLQETFAYLLTKLPSLQLTARMTTFLYPAVKNLSIQARRKMRPRSPDAQQSREASAPAPASPESRAELAAALAAVPPEQREVVLMRFVDDMSLEEIAAGLDIPLGTVKSRLHNALATLRDDPRIRAYFKSQ